MKYLKTYIIILCMWSGFSFAQNNVGIGTNDPHVMSVTEIKDSVRGLLIPRTDTQSVWNYVNNLVPPQGIKHGVTIFETNTRQYYYYDAINSKWKRVTGVTGPMGVTGVTGPTGPRGDLGVSTQWRDSAIAVPFKRDPSVNKVPPYFVNLGDTCGDFYHQTATGYLYTYDCDSSKWIGPVARFRNLGPGETYSLQAVGLIQENMPTSAAGNSLKQLGALSINVRVAPDTVAYVFVTSEGVVSKSAVNFTSFNKVAFDYFLIADTGSGYLNKREIITIGPNNQLLPSTSSQFQKRNWEISYAGTFEGKLSPAGNPLPVTDTRTFTIQTHSGHWFMEGNPTGPTGAVTFVDNATSQGGQYESFAVMNIYIIFQRRRDAAYPY